MPFTFADGIDPAIQAPRVQTMLLGALLTAGFVDARNDDSRGAVWEAIKDLDRVARSFGRQGLLYLRRFAYASGGTGNLGALWIGARLNTAHFKIVCDVVSDEAERARLHRLLSVSGQPLQDAGITVESLRFRATGISHSAWAEGSGTQPTHVTRAVPVRAQSVVIHANVPPMAALADITT